MRIISLVPSWTETLLEAGISLVGRTRYCIHPAAQVASVPIVGGTKSVDWKKIEELKPDLLILDREENPKSFSEMSPCPWWSSHVLNLKSVCRDLSDLAQELSSSRLQAISWRFEKLLKNPAPSGSFFNSPTLEWVNRPVQEISKVNYIIWKNPWMAVTAETYIGSVLEHLGGKIEVQSEKLYPVIEKIQDPQVLWLFSSEPFPFRNHREEIRSLQIPSAIVDGEKFSWFGVRSLRFLEDLHQCE